MTVERREFQTPIGEVWLWGGPEAFSGSKPVVLAILGAFNIEERWPDHIAGRLPQAAVVTAQLPGNHSPQPITHSIGAYAAAFSNVLTQLQRPAVVLGSSIGGLVAFAMKAQNLRGIVALDPPLHTAKLWPLVGDFRSKLIQDPKLSEFLWNVFGIGPTALENRDYSRLVSAISVPTVVIVGEIPLQPVRTLTLLPSLVDDEDQQCYRAQRNVRLRRVGNLGHNIVDGGASRVVEAVASMLKETVLRR